MRSSIISRILAGEVDFYEAEGGRQYDIAGWQFSKHPKFKGGQAYYDVAVVFIPEGIAYSNVIGPICLPSSSSEDPDNHENDFVTIAGEIFWKCLLGNSLCRSTIGPGEETCHDHSGSVFPADFGRTGGTDSPPDLRGLAGRAR